MPTNNPEETNRPCNDEANRIIARTILRSFLATPPIPPHEALRLIKADVFLPTDGTLAGVACDHDWTPLENMVRNEAAIVTLPNIDDLVANYPSLFKSTDAIRDMVQHSLRRADNSYKAGLLARNPTGSFKWFKPYEPAGHAIVIENSTYVGMARSVCRQLADAGEGAQLLSFITPEVYRRSLRPSPPAHDHSGEWSEARDIVKNMLVQSRFDAKGLNELHDIAIASENYGFADMVKQRQLELASNRKRRDEDHSCKGR